MQRHIPAAGLALAAAIAVATVASPAHAQCIGPGPGPGSVSSWTDEARSASSLRAPDPTLGFSFQLARFAARWNVPGFEVFAAQRAPRLGTAGRTLYTRRRGAR